MGFLDGIQSTFIKFKNSVGIFLIIKMYNKPKIITTKVTVELVIFLESTLSIRFIIFNILLYYIERKNILHNLQLIKYNYFLLI